MARKSKLGVAFRVAERVSNPVENAVGAGRPITDAAKSKLYEVGLEGRAEILQAPGKQRVSAVKENVGRFTVRVMLPGEEPYEINVWQSFWKREWELLKPGSTVLCRVDPNHRKRALLLVPETAETLAAAAPKRRAKGFSLDLSNRLRRRPVDSAELLAAGRPARATVLGAEATGQTAPGTDDPVYMLRLELRAEDGPEVWQVEFPQRVPRTEVGAVAEGSELDAAFTGVDDPARVAIRWPRSG